MNIVKIKMKLSGILFLILLNLPFHTRAQQVSWVVSSGGALIQTGEECTTFADGSILNGGTFEGQTTFLPGDNTPRISKGSYDIFIQKLDTNGITQWVVTIGGKGTDYLAQLAIDSFGNIYLAGTFSDSCDFDPGNGVDWAVSKGQTDMFLMKLDQHGNYLWSRQFGGTQPDVLTDLVVDQTGNSYIGGYFKDTVDFSTNSTPDLQNSYEYSGFVMKLSAQGERQWFREYGNGQNPVDVNQLTLTHSKLWVSGFSTADSLNFGTAFTPLWVYSGGITANYLLQLDLQGNAVWVGNFEMTLVEHISTDYNNNILLTGHFTGSADLDPGPGTYPVSTTTFGDFFIIKLDSNAGFLWAKTFTSDLGNIMYGRKVSSFEQGDVVLLAEFGGTVDFDPGPGVVSKTANGPLNVAVLRLNASGDFVWLHTFGGTGRIFGLGLCVDEKNMFVTGTFPSTVDFNPGGSPYLLTATSYDAYLIKFGSYSSLSNPENLTTFYKIYPNPTTGFIQIDGDVDEVQLLDLQGRIIYKKQAINESDGLDFSHLNDGIYFLQLNKNGKHSYHKLVIKH